MSQPQSPVDIANISADIMGQPAVTSITDGSTELGVILGRHYDMVRQQLLREAIWNFAKRRKLISRTRTPEFDFADAYALPPDCLRILSFGGPISATIPPGPPAPPGMDNRMMDYYDVQDNPQGGTEILLNNQGQTQIALRYIADIQDVTKFDKLFIPIFALRLALSTVYQVTKNKEDVKRINDIYSIELPMALAIAGQENPPIKIEHSKFIAARLRGTIGNDAVAGPWTEFLSNWT